jgi:hypothetical protein
MPDVLQVERIRIMYVLQVERIRITATACLRHESSA